MSFPVFAQARDSINKGYAALQNWNMNPDNIPLPDVVNTKRPQLSDAQKAAKYLKSIEGNPDIDIKKVPKMTSRDRIEHDLPLFTYRIPGKSKRMAECPPLSQIGTSYCSSDVSVTLFKLVTEKFSTAQVELIGEANPNCACLADFPVFLICDDKNLQDTHTIWLEWRDQFLDYRNFSGLWTEASDESSNIGECRVWSNTCPEPETSAMAINLQIDDAMESGLRTNVYLNRTTLENYLLWRKQNDKPANFSYILISDNPTSPEKNPGSATTVPAVIGGILGGVAAAALGIVGAIKFRLRNANNNGNSTTTAVPLQNTQIGQAGTSQTTTSMNAPTSTIPTIAAIASSATSALPSTTAANTARPQVQSSSSSSSDESDSVTVDIPPAGVED